MWLGERARRRAIAFLQYLPNLFMFQHLDRMLDLGVGPFIDHGLHGGVPYLLFGEEASPDG
jgi:hypothetical protein